MPSLDENKAEGKRERKLAVADSALANLLISVRCNTLFTLRMYGLINKEKIAL